MDNGWDNYLNGGGYLYGGDFENYKLLFTMCANWREDSDHSAIAPYPANYDTATRLAKSIFEDDCMGCNSDELILKYAVRRANGTYAWCAFEPAQWKYVIRPNETEVGVFLPSATDLPYGPRSKKMSREDENIRLAASSAKERAQRDMFIALIVGIAIVAYIVAGKKP